MIYSFVLQLKIAKRSPFFSVLGPERKKKKITLAKKNSLSLVIKGFFFCTFLQSLKNLLVLIYSLLLNADWLRQRVFFLYHERTFGNQEGVMTWCWLAERTCIKLVSRFKRILKRNFRKYLFWVWSKRDYFILTWKKTTEKRSLLVKKQGIFPSKNVLICNLIKLWRDETASVARSIELQNFIAAVGAQ